MSPLPQFQNLLWAHPQTLFGVKPPKKPLKTPQNSKPGLLFFGRGRKFFRVKPQILPTPLISCLISGGETTRNFPGGDPKCERGVGGSPKIKFFWGSKEGTEEFLLAKRVFRGGDGGEQRVLAGVSLAVTQQLRRRLRHLRREKWGQKPENGGKNPKNGVGNAKDGVRNPKNRTRNA